MMQPQQQGTSNIFSSEFFGNLMMFIMMFAFMKIALMMLQEPAPAAGQLKEKALAKAIGVGGVLVENPDCSEKQAAYQELELDYIAGKLENRSLGTALQAASDITRELLGKLYANGSYIANRIDQVESAITAPGFKAKLSEADDVLATEAINGFAELEFTTDLGRQAKALVISVARQDVANSKLLSELMEKELKRDPRFRE